jgi:hypothetical protein
MCLRTLSKKSSKSVQLLWFHPLALQPEGAGAAPELHLCYIEAGSTSVAGTIHPACHITRSSQYEFTVDTHDCRTGIDSYRHKRALCAEQAAVLWGLRPLVDKRLHRQQAAATDDIIQ